MKKDISFKKTMLIFMIIIISINLVLIFKENLKGLANQQNIIAEKTKKADVMNKRIKTLEDGVNKRNEELKSMDSSHYNQMFYGTWQKTDNIYADSRPIEKNFYETEETYKAKKIASEILNYDLIYLGRNEVIFKNDTEEIRLTPIYYLCTLPYRGDFMPDYSWHWGTTLTLDDLGLNKNEYVTYSTLHYDIKTEEENDILGSHMLIYYYDKIYIKDMNTILLSSGLCNVEYKRISWEDN